MTTINEALERFILIGDQGSLDNGTACAMTLLSWLHDERWTDHPECCHRLIADTVIRANDDKDTTPEMRKKLVRLGQKGALDTWWVPTEVVVKGLAIDGPIPTHYDRAVQMLKFVGAWKKNKQPVSLVGSNLSEANLSGADLSEANLTGANLFEANLARANLAWANLTEANLSGAYGRPVFGMPKGWKLNENNRWIRSEQ